MTFRHMRTFLWIYGFLALIEVGLEVRAHRRGWDTYLFGAAVADSDGANAAFQKQANPVPYGPTGAFPFRSRVVEKTHSAGVIRAWMSSSSYAEDKNHPPPQSFPNQLDALMNKQGTKFEMLNAARAGLSVEGNIRQLREEAPDWHPDIAIFYQMSNDISVFSAAYFAKGADHATSPTATNPPPIANQKPRSEPAPPLIPQLAERTTTFAIVKHSLTPLVSRARLMHDTLPPAADADFRALLQAWIATVKSLGAQPVLCTFATSYDRTNLDRLPLEIRIFQLSYNIYLSPMGWANAIERFNRIIEDLSASEHLPLADIHAGLSGHPELFIDFVHFTGEGNAQVASIIAKSLQSDPEIARRIAAR